MRSFLVVKVAEKREVLEVQEECPLRKGAERWE